MPKGIAGFNVRTIGVSRDQVMNAARQIGSAWILCHNDPDLIREANAAGFKTIYRQSGDETLDMDATLFARTRLDKGATLAYSYNEISTQPKLHSNTKIALTLGKQLIYNYGTHAPRSAFVDALENIKTAAATGQAIGIHFYPDKTHDSTLKEWLDIKHTVGGLWIVTEFGYLRDYSNPYKGWRGIWDANKRTAFLDEWMPFFNAEQMPVCTFCFDPWDQPTVEAAKAEGLGFWDYSDVIQKMQTLNKTYQWSEKMPIPDPTSGGVQATLTSVPSTYINIRQQPNSNAGSDIGDLLPGDVVNYFPTYQPAGTEGWVFVQPVRQVARATGQQVAVNGWVSKQNGTVIFTEAGTPVPPVDPPVDPPTDDSVILTRTEADQMIASLESMAARLKGQPSGGG